MTGLSFHYLSLHYIALSLLAVTFYGLDKWLAVSGARRVPESALHLIGLTGGWPGGFVAQRLFNHKTRKTSFQRIFWVTVVINVAVMYAIANGSPFSLLVAASALAAVE